MLSYGTVKNDKNFLFFNSTLSYHCHFQAFVWMEVKIKRLDSPSSSIYALKKGIGTPENFFDTPEKERLRECHIYCL